MNKRLLEEISGGLVVLLGTCFILSLTWIGVTAVKDYFSGDHALLSQHEWSIVQAAAAAHRDVRLAEPKVIRQKSAPGGQVRTLLGVPAKDGSGNVWMLLDPKASPTPKALPEKDFSLTAAQFSSIEAIVGSDEMKRFLKEHVSH